MKTTLFSFPIDVDGVLNEFNRMMDAVFQPVCKLPSTIISNHFPPCNYYADEDGTLQLEFAVAGYKKDEVKVKFEDDHLILQLTPVKEEVKTKVFQKAIKLSESTTKAYVPFSKYDIAKAEAALEDGLLKVSIPVKEEAKPLSIEIK
jgi:HSP20 family molecular chaperone IbpA